MRFSTALLLLTSSSAAAFTVVPQTTTTPQHHTQLFGYLDNLNSDLYQEADNPDIEGDTKANTDMTKDNLDRAGPGDWASYVEFDEFDGGDGQMGVAGDGNKGLEKFGDDVSPSLAKSKSMSAKNAWGTSTGYADELVATKGVDRARAQQMENWMNQQEISRTKNAHRALTETFDQVEDVGEQDWRTLSKFGVERNQDFDMDETFGEVTAAADLEGTIELHAPMGQNAIHELALKNEYMGFADFRASFTADTNAMDWSIQPTEGSISSRDNTDFILRFRPNSPGMVEGYLVIETEDFKKTWKLVGSTA